MTDNKLKSAINLAKQGFRVFPIVSGSKNPAIKDFPNLATTDETKITDWFKDKDFNVGISTDGLIVVDIDNKTAGKDGFASVKKLASDGKKFPSTFQQVTPSGSIHLVYKAPFDVSNSASKIAPGIDIRGWHGFVVGAGSTIDGHAYEIRVQADVADAPDWLVEACERPNTDVSKAKEVAYPVDQNIAWDRGKQILAGMDVVTEGSRNDAAYKAANKLKDAGVIENDTFALMLEYWKCEPLLGYDELASAVRSAFTYGKEAIGSKSPEALFKNVEGTPIPSSPNPILALNAEYAYVKMGPKYSILHETTDQDNNFKTDFLDEATFHTLNASRMFQPDSGRPEPITKMWMKHSGRRTYDGVVFKPEQKVSERFYNLWRGFKFTEMKDTEIVTDAMKRAYESFTSHIFDNVAEQKTEYYNWVMAWFAHMLQKPYEKPGTALVLRGRKGVGKNAIFEQFQPMFPSHYLVSGDRRYLVSNFNSHLERLLLFVADEAFWSGDKSSEGILKSLITDKRLIIERKGKEALNIESNHRIAILGNDKWVVPASQDERRYAVFNMGETRKQDRAFFGGMERDMRLGGTRYLFTKLRQLDISNVDLRQIPNTDALAKQKLKSLSLVDQWWYDSLCAGIIDHSGNSEWPTKLSFNELKSFFRAYASDRGRSQWLDSDDAFREDVKAVCQSMKIVRENGMYFIFPTIDQARADWDKYLGSTTNWF